MEIYEIDGKEYAVVKPNGKQIREARKIYNRVFAQALREGAFLKANLKKVAEDHGIWSEEQENKILQIRAEIDKYVKIVNDGGIELSDARNYAVKINSLRMEILRAYDDLHDLEQLTAEGQADLESKHYLISQCIVHKNTGKPYCVSVEDFYSKEDDPVVLMGIYKYQNVENKQNLDTFESLPEVKFLKEFKFMDEDYNFINENGEKVDVDGNPIVQEQVEHQRKPFLKDGNPI